TIRKNERINTQLMRSETYLRTIISSIPDLLWIRDLDDRLILCNPRFEELLGEAGDEVIGKELKEIRENRGMASLLGKKGFPPPGDSIFRKEEELLFQNDGHRETSEIIRVPVKDEENRILGFLGIGRDVTNYKELAKEHQENIRFFQDLDRINRLQQESSTLSDLLEGSLRIVADAFPCGRAFLIPLPPQEDNRWTVTMEVRHPQFTGHPLLGRDFPQDRNSRAFFGSREEGDTPRVVPAQELSLLSWGESCPAHALLVTRLIPRKGQGYYLCLEHGEREGLWEAREEQRFSEISRRIGDSLSNITLYRDVRENETFLSNVFESIPLMVFIKEAETLKFLRFNKTWENLLGYPQDAFIGRDDYDTFSREEADHFRAVDREVMATGKMADVEQETVRDSMGRERIFHTRKVPIYDNEGNPRYLFGISEDITEKINTENELKKTRIWLDAFMDSIDDGFLIFDQEARIVLINNTILSYQFDGWDRERLSGMRIEELLAAIPPFHSPRYGDDFFSLYRKVLETGEPVESELSQTGDGVTSWFHTRLFKVQKGFAIVSRNITEQKTAEDNIGKTNDRLNSFMNSASNLMGLFDRGGKLVLANNTAREYLDLSDGDSLPDLDLTGFALRLGDGGEILENCRRVTELGEPVYFESRNRVNNRSLWLSFRLFPSDGGIGFIISDISEMKLLEEQLLQVQKIESIGRLAGGVAHDFNNMLSIIMGYTEIALAQTGEDEEIHEHLSQIMKASRRSARLTSQLLAFARKQNIKPMLLNLNSSLTAMLKILQSLIGEQIELRWEPEEELYSVELDPAQVDQIIANLCVNARDAIEGRGVITIKTENVSLDPFYCALHSECRSGRHAVLSVSDTGCGMDEETRKKIFEPFFTTKEVGKGTGLGLSTVYGIVKQNNGFVEVFSRPGMGTTMRVYFPAKEGIAQPIAPGTATPVRGGNETILIVEDEMMILSMAESMLSSCGYRILTASSPEDALERGKDETTKLDLIISDVVMPGMNGRELLERLVPYQPSAQCLFMSGYTADIITRQELMAGDVHFLQKPFTLQSLTMKVREVLDGNQ
ncbi:MAG: PAS domain-containing protein, partial [Spirochaetales bacterium]|nr:PAS domain-containing protein [Spirochaetales bacterium]